MNAGVENNEIQIEHRRICTSGIARSSIGSGDIRKGITLALQSNDQALMKQCATLLEDTKVHAVKRLIIVEQFRC